MMIYTTLFMISGIQKLRELDESEFLIVTFEMIIHA